MKGHFDSIADQLPERLLKKLRDVGRRRTYQPGQVIHARGDGSNSVLIVNSGRVLVSIDDQHGKRIEVTTLTEGQSLGALSLLSGGVRTHDATAIGETDLMVVTKSQFDVLLDADAKFRDFIVRLLSSRLLLTLELLDDERRLPLLLRLGKQLLRRDEADILRGMSQGKLAEELGVSRYAYGSALSKLREEGLIITDYRQITIPDRAGLSDWVEGALSSGSY